jgi:hypothetical protein
MQNFHTLEHLVTWTGVGASAARRENFANIAASRGKLRGYLTGVEIRVSGTLDAGAADAPKEDIWNVIDSITLKGHLHEWLSSTPGWILTITNILDEVIGTENADDVCVADIAHAGAGSFTHSYLIPISPKHFQPWAIGKGELDGAFPLAALDARGSIEIHTCADAAIGAGDWAIDEDGYTIKVVLHEYWTERVIVPAPWNLRTWTDERTDVDCPGEYGAIDLAAMVDDDPDTGVTLPTGDVRLKVDGTTIYDNVNGIHLELCCNRQGRIDSLDDIADHGIVPLRWPRQSQSMFDVPTGRQVTISNCGVAHVSAGGTPRYMMRRYLPPSGEQLVEWPKLMGCRFDPRADRGRLRVAGHAAGAGVPSDPAQIAGASFSIAGGES